MDISDMIDAAQSLSGDSSAYVETYIEAAKSAIISRVFPFDESAEWEDVPERYHMRACEIAAYMADKRGAEGQTQHIESDVSRIYGSAYIPDSMLEGIMPFCGVPR